MSHISRIKTQIVEKEYLLQSLKDLGYLFEEGEFYIGSLGGESIQAQIKVKLLLSPDIGLRKIGDAYEVVADWWSIRKVKKKEFIDHLTQRYAYHATRARLEAQGFYLANEEVGEKGEIRLVLRRTV